MIHNPCFELMEGESQKSASILSALLQEHNKMNSIKHGKPILTGNVTNISNVGFWILVNNSGEWKEIVKKSILLVLELSITCRIINNYYRVEGQCELERFAQFFESVLFNYLSTYLQTMGIILIIRK
ncbi:MAG: hypothetical protein QG657_4054 [Acidobacteriota bacterium]|nr:hypothetical protein [Acidobacteriota bacterium]